MTDLDGVISSLFRHPLEPSPDRHVQRLGNGTYHMDYHDPDHVYLLSVRQIPRIQLPLERPLVVGEVDGVPVQLVQVAVANHVEVRLDAEHGPAREVALADFKARYQEWEQRGDGEAPPPRSSAETFVGLRPGVSDDIGTPYRFASGQTGATETPWEATWLFLPTPPTEARLLTLRFSPPGRTPVEANLPLPPAEP